MVLQARQALDEGTHVLLFPEGSRTRQFPLDALNNSAALIARRTGIPIQSLLIRFSSPYVGPYLGKGWPLWRRPKLPQHWSVRLGPLYPLGVEPPTQSKTAISPMSRRETAALTARIETELRYFLSQKYPS
jgi:1-acyl-sn-glycerol-3-phosphate acyltransferase